MAGLRCECAVMGVSLQRGGTAASQMVYDGLRMLQHRGQDGSGMVVRTAGGKVVLRKELGLVVDVYPREWLEQPSGAAIGHNRYATQGPTSAVNLQPHRATTADGGTLYLASNGDLPNYKVLRRSLQRRGAQFVSDNDGELLAWFLAKTYDRLGDMTEAIEHLIATVPGAYSCVMLFRESLYAFRDRHGFRPLVTGRLPQGGHAYASETVALDILGCPVETQEDVPAGAVQELVDDLLILCEGGHPPIASCVFEQIYFSRPDSVIDGLPVSFTRKRIGWQLGFGERRVDPDAIVVPVPDSANHIAGGFAKATGLPLVFALTRSHTSRRTFIEPEGRIRDEAVRYKLSPIRFDIEGRVVYLVDDSIVRGTTSRKIVRMLLRAGARDVHLRIGSPPIRWSCYMGIATPTREELVANSLGPSALAKACDATSLRYLSLAGLKRASGPLTERERIVFRRELRMMRNAGPDTYLGRVWDRLSRTGARHCFACFTGDYPIPVPDN